MQSHTLKAVTMTLALCLVIAPGLLAFVYSDMAPHVYEINRDRDHAVRDLGAAIYIASACIFWFWLSVDAPIRRVSRSTMMVFIAAYFPLFVIAVAGYLLYTRGSAQGFASIMWFALFSAAVLMGIFMEAWIINAF